MGLLVLLVVSGFPFWPTPAQGLEKITVTHLDISTLPNSFSETLGWADGRIEVGDESDTSCQLTTVAPVTLKVISNRTDSCNDPLLYGENVVPVESVVPKGSNIGEVRLAVRSHATGAFRVGPVVMRYGNFSDSRPEWTYGGGYLWLYDVGTAASEGASPRLPSEVLRVSLSSGKVLATISMPPFSRIELSADEDGLWFAPSLETGTPEGSAAPQMLYFVGSSAPRAEVEQVRTGEAEGVNWLVTDGHVAWVTIKTGVASDAQVTETFSSPTAKPEIVADVRAEPELTDLGEGSFDVPPVIEAPGFGLVGFVPGWLGTVGTSGAAHEQIVKLDPSTGRFSVVARVSTAPAATVEANIFADGALYLLVNSASGGATLYRIAL
jgi:hypothetical protein